MRDERQRETNITEVLNLDSNNTQLPTYQNHSKSIQGATGGFIKNQFIICGGGSDEIGMLKECYKIGTTNTSLHGTMKEKRLYAASIALTDRLWILGGGDDYSGNILKSTEYILHDGRQEDGPDLPIALEDHAAIEINETHFMLLGGQIHNSGIYTNKTWIYSNGTWAEGPPLTKTRFGHSVGKIRDSVTQKDYIVVIGGKKDYSDYTFFNDIEILEIDGTAWKPGKPILFYENITFLKILNPLNSFFLLLKVLNCQRHFQDIQALHYAMN